MILLGYYTTCETYFIVSSFGFKSPTVEFENGCFAIGKLIFVDFGDGCLDIRSVLLISLLPSFRPHVEFLATRYKNINIYS